MACGAVDKADCYSMSQNELNCYMGTHTRWIGTTVQILGDYDLIIDLITFFCEKGERKKI